MTASPSKRFVCPQCGGFKHEVSKRCWKCARPHSLAAGLRTKRIVIEIAEGRSTKEIATLWGISPKTVEYHWAIAKAKYGLRSPVDAVKYTIRQGWITL